MTKVVTAEQLSDFKREILEEYKKETRYLELNAGQVLAIERLEERLQVPISIDKQNRTYIAE